MYGTQKKYRLLQRAVAGGNLGDVRRYADDRTVTVKDHGARNALHRAVLFERRFIVNELVKKYAKQLINDTDFVCNRSVSFLWNSLSFFFGGFKG